MTIRQMAPRIDVNPTATEYSVSKIGRNTKRSIVTVVYDRFEHLEPVRQEWDDFMESAGCEIFLTFDWCRTWWKYYGAKRDLRIFVFRYEHRVVGIVPMFFENIWLGPVYIRAGKIVSSDFTISTMTPPIRKDFLPEVVQEFVKKLVADYHWDVLHIGPIAGLFREFGTLLKLCRQYLGRDYHVKHRNRDVQTYFLLADSSDKQNATLSKKQSRIVKQKYKALREVIGNDAAIVSQFASTENALQMFEQFVDMHQRHWQRLGRPGHFGDWPGSRQFHRELVQQQLKYNRLRLLQVKAGPYILGYKYAYRFGDGYLEFLDARCEQEELARASLGRIIFSEQLKEASQEGVKYIDSLRGKYEHKLRMGGKLLAINDLYVYPTKLWPAIRIRIFRSLSWMLHMCYYKIWFMRIAPKLPLKRHPLWKIWIRSHIFA